MLVSFEEKNCIYIKKLSHWLISKTIGYIYNSIAYISNSLYIANCFGLRRIWRAYKYVSDVSYKCQTKFGEPQSGFGGGEPPRGVFGGGAPTRGLGAEPPIGVFGGKAPNRGLGAKPQ